MATWYSNGEQIFEYCADFPNVVAQCQIFGGAHPGAMTPNSNSGEIFAQCTYPQFSSSCVYSFGSYHVDKQTDRRRWKHPMLFTMLRCWLFTISSCAHL